MACRYLDVESAQYRDGHQAQIEIPGFAGIWTTPLYYLDNTLMQFGDCKAFVGSIVREPRRRPRLEVAVEVGFYQGVPFKSLRKASILTLVLGWHTGSPLR